MSRVVIVGALPASLTNFRGELIRAIAAAGHDVIAMAAPASASEQRAIESLGARYRPYPVERNRLDPRADLATYRALKQAFHDLRPDIVLAYTIKPVIWSGLALRGLEGPRFFAFITGLGYAFQGDSLRRRALTGLVARLYRTALARAEAVIFTNQDNREEFIARGIVPTAKARIVGGSGVNVSKYAITPLPAGNTTAFLVIARLLGEKGLREYASAAREVRKRHSTVTFDLVGPPDSSPDAIPLAEVDGWHREGIIRYHGATEDVRPFIAGCHVYVLPSYHEGMPRSVLEAMSMGRPILTTDAPGCRETVIPGENGFLVPKADAAALADRIEWFIANREQWPRMASKSRQLTEERFDSRIINAAMLDVMGLGKP